MVRRFSLPSQKPLFNALLAFALLKRFTGPSCHLPYDCPGRCRACGEEIIVLHRNRKPIRAKRMDWRDFPKLARLTTEPPSALPILQEPAAIADFPADYPRSDEFGP